MLPRYTCNRCGKSTVKRIEADPKNCSKCKSPYWNKERKLNIGQGRRNAVLPDDAKDRTGKMGAKIYFGQDGGLDIQ